MASKMAPNATQSAQNKENDTALISNELLVPFRGSLRRSADEISTNGGKKANNRVVFTIDVPRRRIPQHAGTPISNLNDETACGIDDSHQKLVFERSHFQQLHRLFQIIDAEGRGVLQKSDMREFVALRCPAFRRRDEALRSIHTNKDNKKGKVGGDNENITFDEAWISVAEAGLDYKKNVSKCSNQVEFGLEAWMVFCRLISLLQYQEAKRHFARHRCKEPIEGEELTKVVVVDVHPPLPPGPLDVETLLSHERRWSNMSLANSLSENAFDSFSSHLPPPELDLNHCLLAAHDKDNYVGGNNIVSWTSNALQVSVAVISGKDDVKALSSSQIDFILTVTPRFVRRRKEDVETKSGNVLEVQRTMADFEWLHNEFTSHQALGGTLCGRILPPFPKSSEGEAKRLGGAIVSFAKALYAKASSRRIRSSSIGSESSSVTQAGMEDNINERAAILERYLNYFMGHPALSTSFPLNAILKANQSGLDAAKSILNEINDQHLPTPSVIDQAFDLYCAFDVSSNPHLAWIRTAAQAAVALKLHGILDISGMPTASSKLQHASLPKFDFRSWRGEDRSDRPNSPPPSLESSEVENGEAGFENGVVSIESELDGGFDMLPSPSLNDNSANYPSKASMDGASGERSRFHYGHDSTFGVGGVSVDDDIDKLREIIGNLDAAIVRCHSATKSVSKAHKKRSDTIRMMLNELSSFQGLGDDAAGSILDAVASIDDSASSENSSNLAMVDALSWQVSLSSSAVSAAEDVRGAVRAARTANSAKAAAELAAVNAQKAFETGEFSDVSEAKAAQVRSEMSNSHAIHAAVISHEAFVAKRRATMALAHDVRYWNSYRKRDLMNTCLDTAKSQLKAAQGFRESWTTLLDSLGSLEEDERELRSKSFFGRTNSSPVVLTNPDVLPKTEEVTSTCAYNLAITNDHFALSPCDDKQIALAPDEDSNSNTLPHVDEDQSLRSPSPETGRANESVISTAEDTEQEAADEFTASMQSLVDGLMTWGGRFDQQDDVSLPNGMALSIALEESGVLNETRSTTS